MEGRQRELTRTKKTCMKNNLCNCVMNKYEQGENWLSDQRKECIKSVSLMSDIV